MSIRIITRCYDSLRLNGTFASVYILEISFALMAFFCLSWLFPYSGDDWAWGSSFGLDIFHDCFRYYNGRYAGNLLVLILTRSRLVRCVVMSLVIIGIALCINYLAGRKDSLFFWVTILLLSFLPISVRAQGIVWTSGFVNYSISAFLSLLFLCVSKKVFEGAFDSSSFLAIPMFILGIISALIMENITLMLLFLSATFALFDRIKNGRWNKMMICYFAGALIGTIIMFSNGAYWAVASGTDEYREIANDGLSNQLYTSVIKTILPKTIIDNHVILIWIAIGSAALYIKDRKELNRINSFCLLTISIFLSLLAVFSVALALNHEIANDKHLELAIAFVSIIALFCIAYVAFYLAVQKGEIKAFVILASIAIMIAPLAVVTPIGPRNFLPVYIFEIAFVCALLNCVIPQIRIKRVELVFMLLAFLSFIPWANCYLDCYLCEQERVAIIDDALKHGAESASIPSMPHPGTVWHADPVDIWNEMYKLYYEIPNNVVIECR